VANALLSRTFIEPNGSQDKIVKRVVIPNIGWQRPGENQS